MVSASCNDFINVFMHFLKMGLSLKKQYEMFLELKRGGGNVIIFPSLIGVRLMLIYVEISVKYPTSLNSEITNLFIIIYTCKLWYAGRLPINNLYYVVCTILHVFIIAIQIVA